MLDDFKSCVILCGGQSLRMGFDKSLIKIQGEYLIDIIAKKLLNIFHEVLLIVNNREKFKHFNYRILEDDEKYRGSAYGIYTALKNIRSKYAFIIACDMPFVNLELINYMIERAINKDAVIPKNGPFIEPLYGIYSRGMVNIFKREIENGDFKISNILKYFNVEYIDEKIIRGFDSELSLFTNLNSLSDLLKIRDLFSVHKTDF
ncbi:MAG: molybdenum cofactor guanylyltransferase [Oscillospiraceae bacterium]|nr:molybdenum cofactor guanylyltransferase [Oscillospiraceae bacterium]